MREMSARLLICAITLAFVATNQANAAMTMEQIEKTSATMRNTCTTKMNADPALVAGIQKGEFPDDRALKCYTHCVMKTLRTFKNGRVDDAMMIKQVELMMPADMVGPLKATTLECAKLPPTGDDCETTFQFVKCSYETDADHFFFP